MMVFKPKPCPISPTTITNDPNSHNEHCRELLGQIFFVKVMCDGQGTHTWNMNYKYML